MRRKQDLTLQKKYLVVASDVELSQGYVFSHDIEALMTLAKKGELHSIADIFYLAEEDEKNERIKDKTNALHFYPKDFVSDIRKLPVVQKIKQKYFEMPRFLMADECEIMAGMVADKNERDSLYFNAAKNYLAGFRDYNDDLSGAFFLRILERSAKLNKTTLEKSPVAESVKTFLLWGDAKKRSQLFNSLVSSVKKDIINRTRNKEDDASKFARAFTLKNDNLNKNKAINKEAGNIFRGLADSKLIWSLQFKNEDIKNGKCKEVQL